MTVYALDPLSESRVLAIVHVVMHDALNAVSECIHRSRCWRVRGTKTSIADSARISSASVRVPTRARAAGIVSTSA